MMKTIRRRAVSSNPENLPAISKALIDVNKVRLGYLDIVRGLAALTVLMSHLETPPATDVLHDLVSGYNRLFEMLLWCNEGLHPGLVIFIVLSGFCIHLPSARKGCESVNLPKYARRRFFRIYPVMVAAMGLGYASLALNGTLPVDTPGNFIANLLVIPAFVPILPPYGNTILLTVAVECLLYGRAQG